MHRQRLPASPHLHVGCVAGAEKPGELHELWHASDLVGPDCGDDVIRLNAGSREMEYERGGERNRQRRLAGGGRSRKQLAQHRPAEQDGYYTDSADGQRFAPGIR